MGKKRKRGTTIKELRWPINKPGYEEITQEWPSYLTVMAFKFVWKGYDLLQQEILDKIDCSQADKQIEKSISSSLQLRINRIMTGDELFDVQHEVPEFETAYSDQAQPPSYDIAFILRANPRIILPLEAKVLPTEKNISKYIKEIKSNFLTCRYAPFSSEAGMLGYLLKGDSNKAFENISKKICCTLADHPDFLDRSHKTSEHQRTVPPDKKYPHKFRCHHLIFGPII